MFRPRALQVAAESLVSYCRSMKRLKATCWFVQTVLSSHWYETAAQRNAAPGNAKSRGTSPAGELYLVPVFIWCLAHGSFMATFPQSSSSPQHIYIFVLFYHLWISQLFPGCFFRAFNFQRHSKKCHLLPYDRFTNNVQKQANVSFTLYEKKGKYPNFLTRTFRCREGFTRAGLLLIAPQFLRSLVSLLMQ